MVIETTGLANPGPVAQTFFMDEEVSLHYMLDAVITVVDARHAMAQLDEHEEAQRQVGFADRILLSKTDLCSADEVATLVARLKRMNPRAPIGSNSFGKANRSPSLLDLRGFKLNDKLDIDPDFLAADEAQEDGHVHDEHCGHDHTTITIHHGHHSDDIAAFVFKKRAAVRYRAAGQFPRRPGPGVRSAHAALQGRTVDGGRGPQGRVPGRAPDHGQRTSAHNGWTARNAAARWCSLAEICRRRRIIQRIGAMFDINYRGFST